MRSDHEVAYWPFFVKQGQESEADKVISEARASMEEEMVRSHEVPAEYEYDVISDGKPVRVGQGWHVQGVGTVPADVVLAGLVVAWRKGTPKPKISGAGRMG